MFTKPLLNSPPLLITPPTTNHRRNNHRRNTHNNHSTTTTTTTTTTQTPLTHLTTLLWSKTLPPQLLITTVRSIWTSTWQLMMTQLAPSDPNGNYNRPTSQFPSKPNQLSRQNQNPTLHLYIGLPCPWAHRALIVRALKGLEPVIPVSVVEPGIDGLWVFKGRDSVTGCRTLKEVYKMRVGGYNGRSTVPMLWDWGSNEVVCNESYDIIRLFNECFNDLAENPGLDLEPSHLKERIDEWNRVVYPNVNNGVYRCGFAQTQEAYDLAVNDLFDTLDMLEDHLSGSRYLCGDTLTLADVCLFTTLIRFDLVYNVMFKCTKKKLVEYPNLHGYMRDIYQIPKIAKTCNLEAMMDGYYKFLFPLNPGNIRPVMPSGCDHKALLRPHHRETMQSTDKSMVVVSS